MARGGAISYGYWNAPIDRARVTQTEARLRDVDKALMEYRTQAGTLPDTLEMLNLADEDTKDGWGFRFRYMREEAGNGYRIRTVGALGRVGRSELEIRRHFAEKTEE